MGDIVEGWESLEKLSDYPYMFNWVNFEGKSYPVRSVDCGEEWGTQNISVESLQSALHGNDEDETKDPKARAIDEGIFFYVDDAEFALPADELGRRIADSLG